MQRAQYKGKISSSWVTNYNYHASAVRSKYKFEDKDKYKCDSTHTNTNTNTNTQQMISCTKPIVCSKPQDTAVMAPMHDSQGNWTLDNDIEQNIFQRS